MADLRKPSEGRRVIHETKVKIDLRILRDLVDELKLSWEMAGAMKGKEATKEQRSLFSQYNTVRSFKERYDNGEDFVILPVSGGVAGASARVYYFPSITSLCKKFRKCIVPLKEDNVFLFFDLKACEFYLNCIFCKEVEAVYHYLNGEDIYLFYKDLFPLGSDRKLIKESLIANMYGTTPYRVALNLGLSENRARMILNNIANKLPSMTSRKLSVISMAERSGVYRCPSFNWDTKTFDTSNLIDVYNWKESGDEFKPLLALSAYVQSAAGYWMQQFISNLEKRVSGTILTVFDSCLFEVRPDRVEAAKNWVKLSIKPFLTDDIRVGKTFYGVYSKE